jgi:hypothetical protein
VKLRPHAASGAGNEGESHGKEGRIENKPRRRIGQLPVRIQLHQYFHFGFLAARQPFSKILSTLLADRLGVKMMAEAGYHPDFILALFDPEPLSRSSRANVA